MHANHPAGCADTQKEDDGNPLEPTNSPDRSHQGGSNPVREKEAKLASEDLDCPMTTKESLRKSPFGTHHTNHCLNKTTSQGSLSSDHSPQLSIHRPLSPKRPIQICSHNLPNLVQEPSKITIHIPRFESENNQTHQNLPYLQNKPDNILESIPPQHPPSLKNKSQPIYFVEFPEETPSPLLPKSIPSPCEVILSRGFQDVLKLKRRREEYDDKGFTKKRLLQLTESNFQVLQLNQYGSNIRDLSSEAEEAG
ncbi:hypothetical protein RJT34_25759 [Clitoria ternatea]|uniref:Uncharacterized protein n=1 Tax=Clitoria ternatea TaxID=43366 RepID=A0AAN9FQD8_CLITE